MAYRFKLDESATKGFRRVAREQLDLALSELRGEAVLPGSVHSTRKALKRLRALLRLASPGVGQDKTRRHNAALRDVGRLLSARRDEAVLLETLGKLKESASDDERAALAPLARHLEDQADHLKGPLEGRDADEARRRLVREARWFSKAALQGKAIEVWGAGLEDSYRVGRKALKHAKAKPSDETFHELRKAVQTHWRQMSLLVRAWPAEAEVRVRAARELSQILGDDHDLAMLRHAAMSSGEIKADDAEAIGAICSAVQARARVAALLLADRLFAEKPQAFRTRIVSYWQTARSLSKVMPVQPAKDSDVVSASVPQPVIQPATPPKPVNGASPAAVEPPPAEQVPKIAAKTPARGPSQGRS